MRASNGRFANGGAFHLKHGKAKSKVYNIWCSMRARCGNPNAQAYKNYGARGISVCARWESFENFYEDMGDPPSGLTLDRIDNDKGYSPENCRWASRKVQGRNKRGIKLYSLDGEQRPLCEWADIYGLKLKTVWARLDSGWTVAESLKTPIRQSSRWFGAKHGVRWSEPVEQAA